MHLLMLLLLPLLLLLLLLLPSPTTTIHAYLLACIVVWSKVCNVLRRGAKSAQAGAWVRVCGTLARTMSAAAGDEVWGDVDVQAQAESVPKKARKGDKATSVAAPPKPKPCFITYCDELCAGNARFCIKHRRRFDNARNQAIKNQSVAIFDKLFSKPDTAAEAFFENI